MKKFIYIIIFSISVFSCKKTNEEPTESVTEFNRLELLENIGATFIEEVHQDFYLSTLDLKAKTSAFIANKTESNLINLQESWKLMNQKWKHCENYKLGDISNQYLHANIQYWPARIAFIDNYVNTDTTTINENYINNKGASSKGISGLEYLIFNPEYGNDTVINRFTINNRLSDYIFWSAHELTIKSAIINDTWSFNGNGYYQVFISNGGTGISSPLNQLANSLIAQTENVINQKIGKPLGVYNFDNPQPEKVEAPYSRESLILCIHQLTELHRIYNGATGVGFDDYLIYMNDENTATQIDLKFQETIDLLNLVSGSLYSEVQLQNANLEAAFTNGSELIQLLKTDMAGELNIIVTASDNDGD